jgi:hypothetical protein
MVFFHPNLVYLGGLETENISTFIGPLAHFMVILPYFMVICHISWSICIFFTVLVCSKKKNLATLHGSINGFVGMAF